MENLIENQWVCYILKSLNPLIPNRTYVGSTNSIQRRIKQHNGILKGGAKATLPMRPNEIFCVIAGFKNHKSALRCEWLLKHPTGTKKGNQKYCGIIGKIQGINHLIVNSEKWKIRSEDCPLKIWINQNYLGYLDTSSFGSNIEIFSC